MTQQQLSAVSGVADAKISAWMRNTRSLSNDNVALLDDTLKDVAAVIALCDPIPLDLRNTPMVKELIRKMKNGELDYLIQAKKLTDDPQNSEAIRRFESLRSDKVQP